MITTKFIGGVLVRTRTITKEDCENLMTPAENRQYHTCVAQKMLKRFRWQPWMAPYIDKEGNPIAVRRKAVSNEITRTASVSVQAKAEGTDVKLGPFTKKQLDELSYKDIKQLASKVGVNSFGKKRDFITKAILRKRGKK